MPCRRDSVGKFFGISKSLCDSVGGGGVVAEIFRDLKKPMRFSGGGGVVGEIFRGLKKPTRFAEE